MRHCLVFLLLLLAVPVGAVPETTLTFEQAATIALAKSPRMEAALARLSIARETSEEVASPARFQGSVEAGIADVSLPQTQPVPVVSGGRILYQQQLAGQPYGIAGGRIRLRQLLFDGGRIAAQIQAARAHQDAARQLALAEWNSLYLDIQIAFCDVLEARQEQAVAQRFVESIEADVKAANSRYQAGEAARGDILYAEYPLAEARFHGLQAQEKAASGLERLNALLGLPAQTPWQLVPLSSSPEAPASLEDAVKKALAERGELQAARSECQSADHILGASTRENGPKIYVGGEYTPVGYGGSLSTGGYQVGLIAEWPFLDGNHTHHLVARSQAQVREAQAKLRQLEIGVEAEVRQAYRALRLAEEGLVMHTAQLAKAREAYRVSTGQYQAGVASALDVKAQQRQLYEAELAVARTQLEKQRARARLDWAQGSQPPVAAKVDH